MACDAKDTVNLSRAEYLSLQRRAGEIDAKDTVNISRTEYLSLQRWAGEMRDEVHPFLCEEFTVHCPCHGQVNLPMITKLFVDTRIFKRMKHIKQLAMCSHVYPGAVHDRFFHSIGTAHLAYEMIKGIRSRQVELVDDNDVLCVVIAALCHDIGHPAFSHVFEVYMHSIGKEKREALGISPSPEEEREVNRYEVWNHEDASLVLLQELFQELQEPLRRAGLTSVDLEFIKELINPPKKELERFRVSGTLRERWGEVIHGRPVEKAWLLEIVSNWRSGLDVDKFDYLRRDAKFLGIEKQFDHSRYFQNVRVTTADCWGGVPTLSVASKDRDMLREDVLELRKSLHRRAYQHKTVRKLELHMIKVLHLMDEHCYESYRIRGKDGRRLRMSEAALEMDVEAYLQITDACIEGRLWLNQDDGLDLARQEYNKAILERQLMRSVGTWEVRGGETQQKVLNGVLQKYDRAGGEPLEQSNLRISVVALHQGMKEQDPLAHVLFHDAKSGEPVSTLPANVTPLETKMFLFYDPDVENRDIDGQLHKLRDAFHSWAKTEDEARLQVEEAQRRKARLDEELRSKAKTGEETKVVDMVESRVHATPLDFVAEEAEKEDPMLTVVPPIDYQAITTPPRWSGILQSVPVSPPCLRRPRGYNSTQLANAPIA